MTEETQIDPPWKASLRLTLTDALREGTRSVLTTPGRAPLITAVMASVLPHMETAYRVGRMAGSSASAARLAQKNLEQAKKLREVREAINYDEGATYSLDRIVDILDAES